MILKHGEIVYSTAINDNKMNFSYFNHMNKYRSGTEKYFIKINTTTKNIDIINIRESTEGNYKGIEAWIDEE